MWNNIFCVVASSNVRLSKNMCKETLYLIPWIILLSHIHLKEAGYRIQAFTTNIVPFILLLIFILSCRCTYVWWEYDKVLE